jgi:hypothetical protein
MPFTQKNTIPRRIRQYLWTEAENSIMEAMRKVEEVGADPELTNAVVKLNEAFNHVANYVDEQIRKTKSSFIGIASTNKTW